MGSALREMCSLRVESEAVPDYGLTAMAPVPRDNLTTRGAGWVLLWAFLVSHFAWIPLAIVGGGAVETDAWRTCGERLCVCVRPGDAEPACPLCPSGGAGACDGACSGGERETRWVFFDGVPVETALVALSLVGGLTIDLDSRTVLIFDGAARVGWIAPTPAPESLSRELTTPPPRIA